jgi:two-component system sensor histidine kinase KdpD
MTRLANNLLDMARLEAGGVKLKREWYPIEEIVGGVLTRLQTRLENHPVKVNLPPGLPLVQVDAVMIEQVLENLLENALTRPSGTAIEVGAEANPSEVAFWVADRGPDFLRAKKTCCSKNSSALRRKARKVASAWPYDLPRDRHGARRNHPCQKSGRRRRAGSASRFP